VSEPGGRLYWRIVRSNPASWVDFLANAVKDLPARSVELRDPLDWASISVFDAAEEAAERARRYGLGRYLAALRIPEDGFVAGVRVVVRQTYGPGHYSLLAGPVTFVRAVERVVPVGAGRTV
jgi:hypothetical protein